MRAQCRGAVPDLRALASTVSTSAGLPGWSRPLTSSEPGPLRAGWHKIHPLIFRETAAGGVVHGRKERADARAHDPRHDQRLCGAATASHPATGRLRVRYFVARPPWPFCETALCARETFQRSGMTSTGRCACTTTADDTLPRSADWTRDRPRAPTTIGSASSFLASSQIARQLLPFATLPRASNPAVRARASPLP